MSHGEFQKRIKEYLKYWRERQITYFEDKTHLQLDAAALSSNIVQFVEEGKKEIVPIIKVWFQDLKNEYSGMQRENDLEEEYNKILKWLGNDP